MRQLRGHPQDGERVSGLEFPLRYRIVAHEASHQPDTQLIVRWGRRQLVRTTDLANTDKACVVESPALSAVK